MSKYVYVLKEEGSWDYEPTNYTEVYENFEDALKAFKEKVKTSEADMQDWTEDAVSDTTINESEQTASFETYEDGDFNRLHDTITISRKEVK